MSEPTAEFVTHEVNQRIDAAQQRAGLTAKEGLIHSILMLALTDPTFMQRACEMARYLGDVGSTKLNGREL